MFTVELHEGPMDGELYRVKDLHSTIRVQQSNIVDIYVDQEEWEPLNSVSYRTLIYTLQYDIPNVPLVCKHGNVVYKYES